MNSMMNSVFFFFQAEDGIRDIGVTGVQTCALPIYEGEDNAWLLVKKRDEHAVGGWEPDDHPRSVKSGRTNEEVAADPTHLWRSDLPAVNAAIPVRPAPATDEELAALDALGTAGTWSVHGRDLKVTNLR